MRPTGQPPCAPLVQFGLVWLGLVSTNPLSQGFIIDTEGNAVLARHWPLLAPRLTRLVLRGLHLMVPTDMAQVRAHAVRLLGQAHTTQQTQQTRYVSTETVHQHCKPTL